MDGSLLPHLISCFLFVDAVAYAGCRLLFLCVLNVCPIVLAQVFCIAKSPCTAAAAGAAVAAAVVAARTGTESGARALSPLEGRIIPHFSSPLVRPARPCV